ncbi:glycosyltransferase family 2 protein [Helicobacter felis]|uniref:glycosyltransferase family 2 protein n=1 Tax=Helicobacter felis TaxID=214 RepID=UPI000CEE75C0|nr:glycosyltransferase family 2 protein [Helicobacter felis]
MDTPLVFKKTYFSSVALVITTYNQEARLSMVLDSVLHLACLPNEVLIADDGSTESTRSLVQNYQPLFQEKSLPLKHIWQEDLGFRAAKSRNNAIKEAHSEYVIIVDTDMILSPMFIYDHLYFARPKLLLQGTRITLNAQESAFLLENMNFRLAYNKHSWKNFRSLLFARLVACRTYQRKLLDKAKIWRDGIKWVRSANMSFSKTDFDAIEGFHEGFVGWGGEDSEFVARFLFNGGEAKKLRFSALAYHIHHQENSRHNAHANHILHTKTLLGKKISWKDPPV